MSVWIARDKDNSLWIYRNKPIRTSQEVFGETPIEAAYKMVVWLKENKKI